MKFIAFNDTRVASKTGHVLFFHAGQPREVPAEAVRDVVAAGVAEFTPARAAQMANAARLAQEALQSGDAEDTWTPAESVEEDADPVRDAVLRLMAEKDPNKLTKDGVPKVTEVRKLLPKGVSVDGVQIYDIFLRASDGVLLAAEDGVDEKEISDAELLGTE